MAGEGSQQSVWPSRVTHRSQAFRVRLPLQGRPSRIPKTGSSPPCPVPNGSRTAAEFRFPSASTPVPLDGGFLLCRSRRSAAQRRYLEEAREPGIRFGTACQLLGQQVVPLGFAEELSKDGTGHVREGEAANNSVRLICCWATADAGARGLNRVARGRDSGGRGSREGTTFRRRSVQRRRAWDATGRRFSGIVSLQLVDVLLQFLFTGEAREVELEHLQGPFCRLLARPQADEQAGDDAQIQLDRDAVGARR